MVAPIQDKSGDDQDTMRLQIIQLEPYDDVVSVRDRLAFVRADRVLLVWPPQTETAASAPAILSRKLDLVLVHRAAVQNGLRLALVTHESQVIAQANDLNLSVFGSIDAGSRIRWKRPYNQVFTNRATRPEYSDQYEVLEAARRLSRIRQISPEESRRAQIIRIAAAVILAVTLFSGAYIVLPSATVRIYPAHDQLTTTVALIADSTIVIENVDSGHVPATLAKDILIQRQATLATSGVLDVANTVASGTVIFTNQTTKLVSVPKGTIVTTLSAINPARFQTTTNALIDVGGSAEITIQATVDSAGPLGNIEANLITAIEGDLNKSLTVRNLNPTQGGTLRSQKIVTKADQDKLLALVRQQIVTTSIADIKLTSDQFIIPGSIKILEERPEWTTYSAFVGDAADTLTLTLKARIQALIVDQSAARKTAYVNLAKQLGTREIVVESVSYKLGRVDPINAAGQATFLMTASGEAISQIDPDVARSQIVGMGVNDAQALLERNWLLDPLRPPQFELQPSFGGRLPVLPIRIDVAIVP
jgi:hypothetical protein